MNENWTFVCASAELLPGEMKGAIDEVTGAGIVVFNLDGELYALEDRCSHDEVALSSGDFDGKTGQVECLLHGARFDIKSGQPLCPPAYSAVQRFPVKREFDAIWVRDDRD